MPLLPGFLGVLLLLAYVLQGARDPDGHFPILGFQLQRRGVRELPVALIYEATLPLWCLLRGFPLFVGSSGIAPAIGCNIGRAINRIFVTLVLDTATIFLRRVLTGAGGGGGGSTTTDTSEGCQLEGLGVIACHDSQHLVDGIL
ncbi:hypothetical protein PG993_003635 [Apiospora rasikravindrae]|uniref:Secreted peptide n=1 Tax=Apiospora rasikravindrae TaxID=990691 RepID=A0ABR1U2E8_9PEZI